ncbi:unnamed protein product [Litomosoides sigmodontis]|uniref:Uncharacterized protein n=1 Tax=Litomosoides sigmodontis TaxID=42156 RepID=A0A3P6UZG3_LITSI|nr:unnamed protein product [Litomosoides sigmodontis]
MRSPISHAYLFCHCRPPPLSFTSTLLSSSALHLQKSRYELRECSHSVPSLVSCMTCSSNNVVLCALWVPKVKLEMGKGQCRARLMSCSS